MKFIATSAACLGLILAPASASADDANAVDVTGTLRIYGESRQLSNRGPLAQAVSRFGAVINPADAQGQLEATLRAVAGEWQGSATLRAARTNLDDGPNRLILDQLTYSPMIGSVRATLGKSVVSWDVGYAFRPNDLVQQEARRPLVQRTLEGRPLVMLEGFDADSAWLLAGYRKQPRPEDSAPTAPPETMLAARFYKHMGAADTYLFGGWGRVSGLSLGTAFSWVASESIELHGSYRSVQRYQTQSLSTVAAPITRTSPYANIQLGNANQALIGMTWTNEHKVSVIAEAWFDGTAPSNDFWRAWNGRSDAIRSTLLRNTSATVGGVAAGNLGGQASQLNVGVLRRTNLFVRTSWTHEQWAPTLDVLYTPVDSGLVVTAALAWQGDRVRLEGGARFLGGARGSLYAQMPFKSLVYFGLTAFF